jgi:hypothetical protein
MAVASSNRLARNASKLDKTLETINDEESLNALSLTEPDDFTKVPSVPVVVECIMSSGWSHFLHTRNERIGMRPANFNLFSACSSSTLRIPKRKPIPALLAMSVYMPARYRNINLGFRGNPHMLWKCLHTRPEIFRPLTRDIIRYEYARQSDTNEGCQYDVVHVAVSSKNIPSQLDSMGVKALILRTFRLSEGHRHFV